MFNKLRPVWLVARRELRDQLRDWRVLTPMLILTLVFPFLVNEFARQSVDFMNQFEANLIIDRLVPFAVLIIGFFPITISLVVALESFVGEKERGTIEPLLTAPFDDWQLYFGKFLVGVLTPLFASYTSIGLYLFLASQQGLQMPNASVMVQLLLLTASHAFLMVSAAIVISVQSTSVKAANLLASFVVIPVAILMQGETVLLFWGSENILWLAIVGVIILSLLLMRVGIAHFEREYLLGREIDTLNFRWMVRKFWASFTEGTTSVWQWYRKAFGSAFHRSLPAMAMMIVLAGVTAWLSYDWVVLNVADVVSAASAEEIANLEESFGDLPDLSSLGEIELSAPFLFLNNTRAVAFIFLAGLASFSVLGILLYMLNISLIGGVYGLLELLGLSPLQIFLAGVLPHGIFELPALLIGSSVVLYIGAALVTPQTGKSMGEVIIELMADWAKIFIGLVVPFLAIAALIEAYITPILLLRVLGAS